MSMVHFIVSEKEITATMHLYAKYDNHRNDTPA